MAPANPLVDLCGAHDARHIRSVLCFLHAKAEGLDTAERQALLAHAPRLPGLGGVFVEERGGVVFRVCL